ncbi:MAG TPA: UPF0149 family protein [Candidatus Baltobacteraceae bacterium]|nr:UPF0149 family protein [Candidatus Baltobacteraceae bacterium]
MPKTDKRVFDARAKLRGEDRWLVLAISADATLADLHLALLGAFGWSGRYTDIEKAYRFELGSTRFEAGRGSRTALRKLLDERVEFAYKCDPAGITADCSVVGSYEVSSRRHYPKVIEAHQSIWTQSATWKAQIAARREYRDYERRERRVVSRRTITPSRAANSAYAHGFFSALVAGPMAMPTRWLQRFLNAEHDSIDDLNASTRAVMTAYNKVADHLLAQREQFGNETLAIAREDADGTALVDWHRGFLDAMDLSPDEWTKFLSRFERKDILSPLALISQCSEDLSKREWLADRSLRENIGRSLGVMTARLWEAYRGEPMVELEFQEAAPCRVEAKVGRNEPCPCGSGKKYKRCCGSMLRAV